MKNNTVSEFILLLPLSVKQKYKLLQPLASGLTTYQAPSKPYEGEESKILQAHHQDSEVSDAGKQFRISVKVEDHNIPTAKEAAEIALLPEFQRLRNNMKLVSELTRIPY